MPKMDDLGNHPWKAEVTQGDPGVSQNVIDDWYADVYEPSFGGGDGSDVVEP